MGGFRRPISDDGCGNAGLPARRHARYGHSMNLERPALYAGYFGAGSGAFEVSFQFRSSKGGVGHCRHQIFPPTYGPCYLWPKPTGASMASQHEFFDLLEKGLGSSALPVPPGQGALRYMQRHMSRATFRSWRQLIQSQGHWQDGGQESKTEFFSRPDAIR